MRRNYLLLPLLGLLAVTYAAPDDKRKFVRVITEPKPGEEYVSIHTGKPSSGVHGKPLGMKIFNNYYLYFNTKPLHMPTSRCGCTACIVYFI